jgi:shikimate kinase
VQGYQRLRDIEAATLAQIPLAGLVVATGGSAVYSPASMERLAAAGPIVYLQADLATLEARVRSQPLRGIASPLGQSLGEIFAERTPLYQRYADITLVTQSLPAQQLAEEIYEKVNQ